MGGESVKENNMNKKMVEVGVAIWGILFLLSFVTMVYGWTIGIPAKEEMFLSIVVTVFEVIAFAITAIGLFLTD